MSMKVLDLNSFEGLKEFIVVFVSMCQSELIVMELTLTALGESHNALAKQIKEMKQRYSRLERGEINGEDL